jgi:hypothetical protein
LGGVCSASGADGRRIEARNSLGDSSASLLEEKEALELSSGKRVRCVSFGLLGDSGDWYVVLDGVGRAVGRAVARRGNALDFGSVKEAKGMRLVVGVV